MMMAGMMVVKNMVGIVMMMMMGELGIITWTGKRAMVE